MARLTKFLRGLKLKHKGKEVRLYAEISSLHEDPSNARIHDEKNQDAIRGSMKEFGQQKPLVVDRKGMVLAGNGRLVVARAAGEKELWVTVSDLDGVERIAFSLADNRTAEFSDWDFESLAKQVGVIVDEGGRESLMGWSDSDLHRLLGEDWSPPEVGEDPEKPERTKTAVFTLDQWKTIEGVVSHIRKREKDESIPEGGAIMVVLEEWEESLVSSADLKGT